MKYLFFFSLSLVVNSAFSQVQVDKAIQLTGSGSEAKLSGIEEVNAPQDAVSAEVEQNNSLTYAQATNTGDALSVALTPAPSLYVPGMIVHFSSSVTIGGAASLDVNSLGEVPIKKNYNVDLASNDIKAGQMVSVIYDGANFQMLSPVSNAPSAGLSAENSGNNSTWISSTSVSDWEDITTHSHTVGQSGRFLVAASFESIDGSGGTNQLIRMNANGKTSNSVSVGAYLSAFQPYTLTMLIDLNAGDVIKLQNQNSWNYCCKNQVKNIKFSLIKVM